MSNSVGEPYISIIVPAFNEEESLAPLVEEIHGALKGHRYCYEIIIVDDGSIDGSREFLDDLAEKDKNCKVIHLRRNCGQTAAMMAGIDREISGLSGFITHWWRQLFAPQGNRSVIH